MLDSGKLQGDYTISGYTRDAARMQRRLNLQLGIKAKTIKIGEQEEFFYYTTYGDVAETQELVVLKLGFVCSRTKTAMSADKLLKQKFISPENIELDKISGNGLFIRNSKKTPIYGKILFRSDDQKTRLFPLATNHP